MEQVTLSRIITGKMPYENVEPGSTILIAYTESGPVNIPIEGRNDEYVERWFGVNSELTNAYREFRGLSSSKVYLIKANGAPDYVELNGLDLRPHLKITSIITKQKTEYPEEETCSVIHYTDERTLEEFLFLELDGNRIDITDKSMLEIENIINRKAFLGELNFYAEAITNEPSSVLMAPQTHVFDIGNNSYSHLQSVFNNLLNVDINQVGIINEVFTDFIPMRGLLYTMVSDFATDKANSGSPCMVTIGIPSTYPDANLYNKLIEFTTSNKQTYTISEYINFVVARTSVLNTSINYTSCGIPAYCALIANLTPGQSTTNRSLPNVINSLLSLNDEEIKELSNKGYVLFTHDKINGSSVYKGVNLLYGTNGDYYYVDDANPTEVTKGHKPYSLGYISNTTLIQDITSRIYKELDAFVGSTGTSLQDIVLAIAPILNSYPGIIKQNAFTVAEELEGLSKYYTVDIELILFGEVESIKLTVSVW